MNFFLDMWLGYIEIAAEMVVAQYDFVNTLKELRANRV